MSQYSGGHLGSWLPFKKHIWLVVDGRSSMKFWGTELWLVGEGFPMSSTAFKWLLASVNLLNFNQNWLTGEGLLKFNTSIGPSPVWALQCTEISDLFMNAFPYLMHVWDFSPECLETFTKGLLEFSSYYILSSMNFLISKCVFLNEGLFMNSSQGLEYWLVSKVFPTLSTLAIMFSTPLSIVAYGWAVLKFQSCWKRQASLKDLKGSTWCFYLIPKTPNLVGFRGN